MILRRLGFHTKMPPLIALMISSLAIIVILAFLSPVIFPMDPGATNLRERLLPPRLLGAKNPYFLGTDHLGRDFMVRIFYATRTTVFVSFTGMIIATALGTMLGLVAGLNRGIIDNFIMFLVDARMAVPFTLLALVAAAIFGSGPLIMILIIGFSGWAGFTRLARGQVLQIKDQQFIESSQAVGSSQVRIVFEHILPNISSPLIVQATLRLSSFILLESSLSFLGLGVQPPEISLGLLVSTGRDYLINIWTLSVFPSIVIVVIMLQVSLIGDWLRDALDPKLARDL